MLSIPTEMIEMIASYLEPEEYYNWKWSTKEMARLPVHTVTFPVYKKCMENPHIRISIDVDYPFHIKESGIHQESFQYLVDSKNHKELLWAIKFHQKLSDELLQSTFSVIVERWLGSLGTEILEAIYRTGRIPSTYQNELPLFVFCSQGNAEIVSHLLQTTKTHNEQRLLASFHQAARRGYAHITRLLLETRKLNFTKLQKEIVWDCFSSNNIEIGFQLLNEDQFDPFATDLLCMAVFYNNITLVAKLLEDKRLVPWVDLPIPTVQACKMGHSAIVELVLKKIRDVQAWDLLNIACQYGHSDVVRVLLKDRRIDPTKDHNQALHTAVTMNRVEVVRLLLEDKRVDPSARANLSYYMARNNGNQMIMDLLLQNECVSRNLNL
jgi:ankyrin repeat protein